MSENPPARVSADERHDRGALVARTRDERLVVFVVPDLVDDLVGRRSTAGLVRLGRFPCRSAAWAAAVRYGLATEASR